MLIESDKYDLPGLMTRLKSNVKGTLTPVSQSLGIILAGAYRD